MLSIAIKNALLVTLIIMILHFMIKNHLLERFTPVQPITIAAAPNAVVAGAGPGPAASPAAIVSEPAPVPALPVDQPSVAGATASSSTVDKEEELYNFIFNDDACNQPPKETPYVPEPATIAAARLGSKQPLNNDQVFVSEYDNEISLNGGNLFGSLKGFDVQEATDFMAYEPSAASCL